MNTVRQVLETKVRGSEVRSIPPSATVLNAVEQMCTAHVGALLVVERSEPVGIISERDVMARGVLKRHDPETTTVAALMTRDVVCIEADCPIQEAMAVMTHRRCRHLPVVDGGRLAGIVSIGDLARWVSQQQDYELRMLHEYVEGRYPG